MRRNPFRGVTDVFSEMSRMRELGRVGQEPGQEARERDHATAWVPIADIFAEGVDLVIQVELASLRPEDVDVTLSGGVLTISGIRQSRRSMEDTSFYARERFYGEFRRSINLPENIREDAVSAAFENGMLEVVVRGAAASVPEPRRIHIRESLD